MWRSAGILKQQSAAHFRNNSNYYNIQLYAWLHMKNLIVSTQRILSHINQAPYSLFGLSLHFETTTASGRLWNAAQTIHMELIYDHVNYSDVTESQ